jgi:energy-coupling factor transporter ATP-binding protein EcfA2
MDELIQHLVLVGNPGSGKSTLLNCLLQQSLFNSGTTLHGNGLTATLQDEVVNGIHHVDTPGLNDDSKRRAAAEAIQTALRAGGRFRVNFVLKANGGRLYPDDVTTMMLVLQASQQIGQDNYGVILNHVEPKWYAKVQEYGVERWIEDSFHPKFTEMHLPTTKYVHFNLMNEELFGADDVLVDLQPGTKAFLENGFPLFRIDPEKVQDINAESFLEFKEKAGDLQRALDDAKIAREAVEASLEASEDERRRAEQTHQQALETASQREQEFLSAYARSCAQVALAKRAAEAYIVTDMMGWPLRNCRQVEAPADFEQWVREDHLRRCRVGTQWFPWGHSHSYFEKDNSDDPIVFQAMNGIRWVDHHPDFTFSHPGSLSVIGEAFAGDGGVLDVAERLIDSRGNPVSFFKDLDLPQFRGSRFLGLR